MTPRIRHITRQCGQITSIVRYFFKYIQSIYIIYQLLCQEFIAYGVFYPPSYRQIDRQCPSIHNARDVVYCNKTVFKSDLARFNETPLWNYKVKSDCKDNVLHKFSLNICSSINNDKWLTMQRNMCVKLALWKLIYLQLWTFKQVTYSRISIDFCDECNTILKTSICCRQFINTKPVSEMKFH